MDDKTNDQRLVFDESDLLYRLLGDEILERKMIAAFLVEIPDLILKLKECVAEGDAIQARLQAHTIRGTSANLSAGNLYTAARQVEELCIQDKLEDCEAGIDAVQMEFQTFIAVIRSLGLFQDLEEKA